ncbi:(2,3-dihydroxybenzoyl)adenylate synthase [Cellulomonas phragmiteti]|uniref:2,3-dihydroxybenzoate-AMP ligase n=1 Tax=Cellulomonas phragmiteti TaxID=478780 RepID=A0ABQ4DML3_9CELL|nr:AMP-binding protein [Cellulomonas phragmiteti]GIG40583.1 2,3-dihydroxybenzoate-AMP ligase [Cellulomonas phragmiteti]
MSSPPRPTRDAQGLTHGPTWLPVPRTHAEHLVKRGWRERRTLSELLRAQVRSRPEHLALVAGDVRLTYADLDLHAERCADVLRTHGVQPGDRVLLCVGNRAEHVVAFYAAVRAGAVPVLVLPTLGDADVRAVAVAAEVSAAVVVERQGRRDLRDLAVSLRALPHVRAVLRPQDLDVRSTPRATPPTGSGRDDADAEDLALLTLSGGTTGTPKLIPRTHADYGYNALASARACGVGPDAVYLAVLPAAHNFTMVSPGIVGVLSSGGTVVLSPDPSPTTAFALVERERVTLTSLVPALVPAWLDEARRTPADLGSLRILQVGGARLDDATARRVGPELGCTLQQVFGMAEGLNCYTDPAGSPDVVCTTQGRPVSPGDEVLVVDEQDRPVPDGTPGELLTRGPYTITGYYGARELDTVRFTADGFYRTGDVVTRSPDGDLTVVGRVKDQVNRAGEKIAAGEVEELLLARPDVRGAAVVGAPDPHLGERSVAFLVVDGPGPTREDLRRDLTGRGVTAIAVPDEVRVVAGLPLTGVGKVDKQRLRAWAQA